MMIADLRNTAPPPEWGVTVDLAAVERLADLWAGTEFVLPKFDYPGTPVERPGEWWFDYVTLAVSVLACLWPPEDEPMWQVEHDGAWLDDAPGIFACFTKTLRPGGIDLNQFAHLSDADGAMLFAGRGTLQLIPERVQTLRRTATQVQQRWDGSARHLVEEAGRDGSEIVRLLIETIPAFVDRPATEAGIAHFDKLAHLAAAIMAAGAGWDHAGFSGYHDFPVYPDYMLPRVFRHYAIMNYEPALAALIDNRLIVPADSPAEHAIRWATVYAGARLTTALAERGTRVGGPALDYRLWSIAVLGSDAESFGEHHRTITQVY